MGFSFYFIVPFTVPAYDLVIKDFARDLSRRGGRELMHCLALAFGTFLELYSLEPTKCNFIK